MKKLLLCTTVALTGLALAAPAKADGVKLDLAGHFKGYATWINQSGDTERHDDFLRETEIHFTGETTLDNGLTVGVHHEADIDSQAGGADGFVTEESYAYLSGAWGRVNLGKEDGANYLLQVAAPSADENYDGLRQYINPENIGLTGAATALTALAGPTPSALGRSRGFINSGKLDYADDASGYSNKITYLTPVFSGFQFGASFTPNLSNGGDLPVGGSSSASEGSRAFGVSAKNSGGYGNAYEASGRYEGQWRDFGFTLGGGYTRAKAELTDVGASTRDDLTQYNVGANVAWSAFNVGGAYTRSNDGIDTNGADRTYVLGADYTTGPFKLGASWLNNHESLGIGGAAAGADAGDLRTNRYAGGVVYTYGPGLTFRGSVGYVRSKLPDSLSGVNSTDVLVGTQINF